MKRRKEAKKKRRGVRRVVKNSYVQRELIFKEERNLTYTI